MVGGTLLLAYSVQYVDEGLGAAYVDRLLPADDAAVVPRCVAVVAVVSVVIVVAVVAVVVIVATVAMVAMVGLATGWRRRFFCSHAERKTPLNQPPTCIIRALTSPRFIAHFTHIHLRAAVCFVRGQQGGYKKWHRRCWC